MSAGRRALTVLAEGRWPRKQVVAAVVPLDAPAGPLPEDFLPGAPAVHWRPAAGPAVTGVGAALVVRGHGPERFNQVRDAGRAALAATAVAGADAATWRPRLFGGLAFAPGGAATPPWDGFGDGTFWLPRWCVGDGPGGPWLAVASRVDGASGRAGDLLLLEDELPRLAAAAPARPLPAVTAVTELAPNTWRARVEAIREAIAAGELEKVVAARVTRVTGDTPWPPETVLDRLLAASATCTGFLIRLGGTALVGATPEHLVARRGSEVVAEALAGSWDAGRQGAEDELLASSKDLQEHRLVVDEVVALLGPFCRELSLGDAPAVRHLPGLLHLRTPVRGELGAPVPVLDLVAALHPTPAVGGFPREAAMTWIAGHEREPRGWYTGPVGWFDEAGDGEFVVALRCGLLSGAQALVYAGAGIVRESDPAAEYRETALKQRPMLQALGVKA